MLALVDALPALPVPLLDEWLPQLADVFDCCDGTTRELCRNRLWDVFSGEMDTERAEFCLTWWETRGGRERLFEGKGSRETTDMNEAAYRER